MEKFDTFDQLWNACEDFFKITQQNDNIQSIIEQVILQCNIYKLIDKNDFPETEKIKMKNQTFGEILLTLTNLSLVDDVNVFKSLYDTLERKKPGDRSST